MATAELDDFESGDSSAVDCQTDESALFLPTVVAGGSGVDVEESELMVGHDFKDVGVTADHEIDAIVEQLTFDSRRVASRIACNVGQPDADTVDFKTFGLSTATTHVAVVDVAPDGANRRDYLFESADDVNVADIAGVPNFVAVFEMDRVAVVPTRVGV